MSKLLSIHGDAIWSTLQSNQVSSLHSLIRACVPLNTSNEAISSFRACTSASSLRLRLVEEGLCQTTATDDEVLLAYFSDPMSARLCPNPLFDESWYRGFYPDVSRAVTLGTLPSGFFHFVTAGIVEGRWPNGTLHAMALNAKSEGAPREELDGAIYLSNSAFAAAFLLSFPIVSPLQFYNAYGRFIEPDILASKYSSSRLMMRSEFDDAFYIRRYLPNKVGLVSRDAAFADYLGEGLRHSRSPNDWFDEGWYRAFYPDVRKAIQDGRTSCGFEHYLYSGRQEGRLPGFDFTRALEAKLPGVTRPTLLDRVKDFEQRFAEPVIHLTTAALPRIWFIMPWINADMAFGGYISALELMHALRQRGHYVGVICTEDRVADKHYYLWRESRQHLRLMIEDIPVLSRDGSETLAIGPKDRFIAYSVWDLLLASQLARASNGLQPFLLTQEYEPVFYGNSSVRLLCEQAYNIDHFPMINSRFLANYLRQNQLSIFTGGAKPRLESDYVVFEHKVNRLPRQTAASMAGRQARTLMAYARPESHAERNMFEILLLALRRVCKEDLFGPEWQFIGLGALSNLEPIPLGGGHVLDLRMKMPESEYQSYVESMDIGVSLMFAPHPSVMPFEFATTGAVVVTNTFENRSADDLRGICRNIIPCHLSTEGVADGLRMAAARVEDFSSRERETYDPPVTSWAQSFTDDLIDATFGSPAKVNAPKRPARRASVDLEMQRP